VAVLAAIGAAAIGAALLFAAGGVSAQRAPSSFEVWAARGARHLLIPADARGRADPLPASPAVLERAQDHFAEHCATCHGDDGRGDTVLGRGLAPRVPDLTHAATQDLSDGELAWIVDNGVRLTGMPSFAGESDEEPEHAWLMVRWIRHLPTLTAQELERARSLRDEHEHDAQGAPR
jgi:mono/diheme cytochrome c family protein